MYLHNCYFPSFCCKSYTCFEVFLSLTIPTRIISTSFFIIDAHFRHARLVHSAFFNNVESHETYPEVHCYIFSPISGLIINIF